MQKSKTLKLISLVTAAFMMFGACDNSGAGTESGTATGADGKPEAGVMRDITTMELVKEMGLGINLGNTFEACGDWISPTSVSSYEKAWGSPIITEKMIAGYKECGFGVLRVPVAWSNMMAEDYTINPDYLARVTEVVDWALESDLYVILNIHWDNGWWEGFAKDEEYDECMKKYTRIWEQLTEAYKDYGDKLMFESLNEEGGWESIWNRYSNQGDKEKSYGILNTINQKFVDIVRESGGNNAERHLLIAGYNTDFDLTCDPLYKMPEDPMNRCAVSVHYYTPSTFAILEKDADWGKARTTWGTDEDYAQLEKYMKMMKENFVDKGIPVIVGEFGTSTKNKEQDMINLYLTSVCSEAYKNGLCPVLWDITNVFYNRTTCQFRNQELLDGLMAVKEQ